MLLIKLMIHSKLWLFYAKSNYLPKVFVYWWYRQVPCGCNAGTNAKHLRNAQLSQLYEHAVHKATRRVCIQATYSRLLRYLEHLGY